MEGRYHPGDHQGPRPAACPTLSPLEPVIPGKPRTPPGPWNYSAGGEGRGQKCWALLRWGYFSRQTENMENYFTGAP